MKYSNKENINLGKGTVILQGTEKTEAQWKKLGVNVKTFTGRTTPGFTAVKPAKKRTVRRKKDLTINTASLSDCLTDLTLNALDVIINFFAERELQSQKSRFLSLSKYDEAQKVQNKIVALNKNMPNGKQFKALRLQIKKLKKGNKE